MLVDLSTTPLLYSRVEEISSIDSNTNSSGRARLVDLSSCPMRYTCMAHNGVPKQPNWKIELPNEIKSRQLYTFTFSSFFSSEGL